MPLASGDEPLKLLFKDRPFESLEEVLGQAQRRVLADDLIDFALQGFGAQVGEPIVLKQGDGHAPDQAEFEFGVGFELAQLTLEGADISRPIVRGEQEKERWQVLFVQFDVIAGRDGIHGAAVFSFRGDGPFAFGTVATGSFGAALLLFFSQLLFRHREFSNRNGKGALFIGLMKRSAFVKNRSMRHKGNRGVGSGLKWGSAFD